ncbi:unnamed protein product, partial [Rhizoctonia solani]
MKGNSRAYKHPRRLVVEFGRDKPVLEAVEKAYEFIARNYASGDQVMSVTSLYASTNDRWETDRHARATEVLARHLHDGTSPAKLADAHPGYRGNMTGSRIPIYVLQVEWWFG